MGAREKFQANNTRYQLPTRDPREALASPPAFAKVNGNVRRKSLNNMPVARQPEPWDKVAAPPANHSISIF
jgi:hypothetical protein